MLDKLSKLTYDFVPIETIFPEDPTMTIKRRALLTLTIFCITAVTIPLTGLAHEKEFEKHPARDVVVSYLTYAMGQDWPKSAALIEEKSLAGLRDRYIGRISNAPTFQDEIDMCRALDCTNLKEAKSLDPTDFYIRYHKGIEKRYKVSEAKLAIIMASKVVKVLSIAEETHNGQDLAHVLVRTRHENGEKQISSMELISLLKVKGKWLVTLEANRPTVVDSKTSAGDPPKK